MAAPKGITLAIPSTAVRIATASDTMVHAMPESRCLLGGGRVVRVLRVRACFATPDSLVLFHASCAPPVRQAIQGCVRNRDQYPRTAKELSGCETGLSVKTTAFGVVSSSQHQGMQADTSRTKALISICAPGGQARGSTCLAGQAARLCGFRGCAPRLGGLLPCRIRPRSG